MKHVFAKPYEFDGETFEFLEFDLESVKGSDISAVKKQYAREGNFSAYPTTDSDFCAMLLARITKKPMQFFTDMPANEYCKLTQEVTNFLIG